MARLVVLSLLALAGCSDPVTASDASSAPDRAQTVDVATDAGPATPDVTPRDAPMDAPADAPADAALLDAALVDADAAPTGDVVAMDVVDAAVDAAPHDHGRIASHGMLLTGTRARLFLSHLPAFYEPHRAQVIVEGRLDAAPPALPTDFSSELHSFLPETFSLDALRAGALSELRGTVYRGNHEQGGVMIAADVRFTFTRVVFQSELGGATDPQQGYVVFGSPDALFAAHRIGPEPGFDHLLRVEVSPPLSASSLAVGAVLLRRTISDVVGNRVQASAEFTSPEGTARSMVPRAALSCLEGPGFSTPCR